MGSGKGNPTLGGRRAPGRVLFELAGVDRELAESAMNRAIQSSLQGALRRAPRTHGTAEVQV